MPPVGRQRSELSMALKVPGLKDLTAGTEEGVNTLHLRVTSILTRMDPGGVTATGLPNSSVHPRPLRVPFEKNTIAYRKGKASKQRGKLELRTQRENSKPLRAI